MRPSPTRLINALKLQYVFFDEFNYPAPMTSDNYFSVWKMKGPICLVGNSHVANKDILDYTSLKGIDHLCVESNVFGNNYKKFVEIDSSIIILCIDAFNGIGTIFNKLRYYRDERPEVPIILTSAFFKEDDFSQERLPICDISLKLPLEYCSLDRAFEAAGQNNQVWLDRIDPPASGPLGSIS